MDDKLLRIKQISVFLTLALCPFLIEAQEPIVCHGKPVLGNVEKVLLIDKNKIIAAKMDTGASMSSLSALNIKEIRRNHKTWIEFDFIVPMTDKKITFRAPLMGYTKIIKRKDEITDKENEYSVRPVIFMHVCLGNKNKRIEVNLIDRSQLKYPMIIGAKALRQFSVIVDAERKFVTKPHCSTNY